MKVLMLALLFIGPSAYAAEANCYMGDHGSDSGPCTPAERARVDAETNAYAQQQTAANKPMYAVIMTVLLSSGFPTEVTVISPVRIDGCNGIKADIAKNPAPPGYRKAVECVERPVLDIQIAGWGCTLRDSASEKSIHVYRYDCFGPSLR